MSINQRQHIRFSLDIPALLVTKFGERQETLLQQISIGGCFTDWEENIYAGDEFRLEVELPNKNRLPLRCKAIYRFENTGIGVKFIGITQFERELISKIISHRLEREGLPLPSNPLGRPARIYSVDADADQNAAAAKQRRDQDDLLEVIMSSPD